ncbi:MAG: cytosolic long-chain acyl-CoA thioester hydrolase family protein [Bacillota bacterium]|jgi:acyl-CoA hydrolase|nr:cytosolic long-chain acyl-CoA thioester hydrolase family protein [Bacillota bacterium]
MKEYICSRLVKSEDLNHHGTLFAGRTAEWFVESAFIAAATTIGDPKNIVCLNIHGLVFKCPVNKGDIITFTSRIAHLGKTSIVVHCEVYSEMKAMMPVDGYLTFISIDDDGNKKPHGLILDEPKDEKEALIREKAKNLR